MSAIRREKAKSDWTTTEWEGWVKEAEDMHRLALQNPAFLNLEMWRDEYERRNVEYEDHMQREMKTAR